MRCGDRMRREERKHGAASRRRHDGVSTRNAGVRNGVSRAPHGVPAGHEVSLLANSDWGAEGGCLT